MELEEGAKSRKSRRNCGPSLTTSEKTLINTGNMLWKLTVIWYPILGLFERNLRNTLPQSPMQDDVNTGHLGASYYKLSVVSSHSISTTDVLSATKCLKVRTAVGINFILSLKFMNTIFAPVLTSLFYWSLTPWEYIKDCGKNGTPILNKAPNVIFYFMPISVIDFGPRVSENSWVNISILEHPNYFLHTNMTL